MPTSPIVLRSDDPRVPTLLTEGWSVSAGSWAAEIDLRATDHAVLRAAAAGAPSAPSIPTAASWR